MMHNGLKPPPNSFNNESGTLLGAAFAIFGLWGQQEQLARSLTKHAVLVSVSVKKNRRIPIRIALRILVATIPTASRMMDSRIVPSMPISNAPRVVHRHSQYSVLLASAAAIARTPRYTTAIPNVTQRNTGATVITAVIWRNAATTPMITLAMTAASAQRHLQLQLNSDILSPPIAIYVAGMERVRKMSEYSTHIAASFGKDKDGKGAVDMCTAVTYQTKDFYFGRTLDYEFSYGEMVTVIPRRYPLHFRHVEPVNAHYAVIGMAHVAMGYPLFYDAVNEKGLAMAGLNFVGNSVYGKCISGRENVAQFEFIPWILSQCATVKEAKERIGRIQLTDTAFSKELPPAQLHWIIADRERAITVESVQGGIRIYPNPAGVLTNNPPFDMQMLQLSNYMHLSAGSPENSFSDRVPLQTYSRGMGALGLPGDLSSQSRFVRGAFVKLNSVSGETEEESVSQFFHILGAVEQQRGCCRLDNGEYEITIYTSCCNGGKGIYYYTTYENHQITAVDMHKENLDGEKLICYPLRTKQQIYFQN